MHLGLIPVRRADQRVPNEAFRDVGVGVEQLVQHAALEEASQVEGPDGDIVPARD